MNRTTDLFMYHMYIPITYLISLFRNLICSVLGEWWTTTLGSDQKCLVATVNLERRVLNLTHIQRNADGDQEILFSPSNRPRDVQNMYH